MTLDKTIPTMSSAASIEITIIKEVLVIYVNINPGCKLPIYEYLIQEQCTVRVTFNQHIETGFVSSSQIKHVVIYLINYYGYQLD